ncbi:SDR family oxidoreductase [Sporosarcina sp. 179-K 3D1 HS]|uniref:SDR family NAD(P)-dependent oxidoreductase n=1 Tax=Sporosarcina sp. 179-K 3D1 HS TaxID=3232169 RepID=UPI0039A05648
MKLKGKVALVTGGSSGIGRGICHAFIKEGATVVFVGLNEQKGRRTEQELLDLGGQALYIQADLQDRKGLPSLIDKTVAAFGRLDVLVNNAHATNNKTFEETTEEDMDYSMNTGFWPTFILMQEALPHMKETRGKIINFVSGAGMIGLSKQSSYAAAKEAIRGISRVAANEWGRYGITVNLISPIAKSPGVERMEEHQPNAYNKMISLIPMGRLGDCELDIGRSAVFLASEDADYITGQTIMVDGGTIMVR